jgi:hypothetical protein
MTITGKTRTLQKPKSAARGIDNCARANASGFFMG